LFLGGFKYVCQGFYIAHAYPSFMQLTGVAEKAFHTALYSRRLPNEPHKLNQEFRDYYNLGTDVRLIWEEMRHIRGVAAPSLAQLAAYYDPSDDAYRAAYNAFRQQCQRANELTDASAAIEREHPELARVLEHRAGEVYSLARDIQHDFERLAKPTGEE
jgi:hypothetical protein